MREMSVNTVLKAVNCCLSVMVQRCLVSSRHERLMMQCVVFLSLAPKCRKLVCGVVVVWRVLTLISIMSLEAPASEPMTK